ncbi:MAG: glycosyltransferase family 2 protein [Thermodesulfobacteriota bacterium]|nr:glycosyltransferase family 2 protein [Thermodesulfobacteriota bacterium]
MGNEQNILVIIPAYNEEGSVGKVVEDINTHFPQADSLVVNDGSTDQTLERARASGATVLNLPYNLGIGGAMQAGYQYAFGKGYGIAIRVDRDGQHDPKRNG